MAIQDAYLRVQQARREKEAMEHYKNAPDYVNRPGFAQPDTEFTSMEDVKLHNMTVHGEETSTPIETVFIVDGEDDPNNPIVLEVQVTRIIDKGALSDEQLKEYLSNLLSDACCGFNMAFAKTEVAAMEVAEDWKAEAEL